MGELIDLERLFERFDEWLKVKTGNACVGLDLVWGKKIRAADLLPAVVFAVVFAFLPL